MRREQIVVDGVPMCWNEEGTGVPIVMVHNIPTSPALWRHVVPLVEGRRLAWEMVGYGTSIPAGDGRDISLDRQADYLLAWMRAVDLAPAVLVGHDLGGGVVQIAAVRDPADVRPMRNALAAASVHLRSFAVPTEEPRRRRRRDRSAGGRG